MLTAAALATIGVTLLALVTRRASPVVAMTLVPLMAGLALGHSPAELKTFFVAGVASVTQVVVMFVFAIVYFGLMQDVGLFDPLLDRMVRASGGNVVGVAVGTAALAMIAHLDGSGATTFLITVPALLPLYLRLGMDPHLMLLLLCTGAGVFNMFPWAGPLGRAAAVIQADAAALWRPLIPVQVAGAVLLFAMAVVLGRREEERLRARAAAAETDDAAPADDGGAAGGPAPTSGDPAPDTDRHRPHARPDKLRSNLALTAGVVAALVTGVLPPGYVFMIGVALALPWNFPRVDDQHARLKAHAPNALLMASILLAAGSFLGVLEGTGMLKALAADLVRVLPAGLVPYLHLALGVVGLPMDMLLSTDAYYFALLPVVVQVVGEHGVSPEAAVYALSIGNMIGAFVSPFSPALWLALGMARCEMGRHLRYSLPWMWGYSLCLLGLAWVTGWVPWR